VIAEHLKVLLEKRKDGKILAIKLGVQLSKEITEVEFFVNSSKISSLNEI
jgi:hypothetical protein